MCLLPVPRALLGVHSSLLWYLRVITFLTCSEVYKTARRSTVSWFGRFARERRNGRGLLRTREATSPPSMVTTAS